MRTLWMIGVALAVAPGCGKNCGIVYVAGGTLTVSLGDRTFTADNPSAEELETYFEPPAGFIPEVPQGGWLEQTRDPADSNTLIGYFSWEPDGDGICGEDDLNELEVSLTFTRDLLDTANIVVREVDGPFVEQSVTGGRGLEIDQFAPWEGTWTLEEPAWGEDTACVPPEGPIVVEWAFDPEQELDRTERCSG